MRLRLAVWGALGSLALLALWFRPDVPPAYGQGVGIYSRASCSTINGAVAGQTWCFDTTARKLTVYDGVNFSGVTLDPFNATTTILNMVDFVNYALDATATGTNQQIGLYLHMKGSNTAAAPNYLRIPLLIHAETCNGCGGTPDSVEGMNVTVVQNLADATATTVGVEISFDNNHAADPIDGVPNAPHYGLTVDAYGFATGPAALRIGGGSTIPGGGTWWRGLYAPLGAIQDGGYVLVYDGNGKGPGCPGSCVSRVAINSDGIITAASLNIANGVVNMTGGNNRILFAGTASNMGDNVANGQLTFVGGTNGYAWYEHNGQIATMTLSNGGGLAIASPTGGNIDRSLNVASATFLNGLASQVASGSGINLYNVRGLSASSSISNNLRGTCTFSGAATCAVVFANNEPNANYFVMVGGIVNVSAKAVTGFTLTATGTNSNAVDWMLVR